MKNFIRVILRLELEEKILNASVLVALVSLFFPWLSGEWLGGEFVSFSGLGFYTSFIGVMILLLLLFTLLITVIPAASGHAIIHRDQIHIVRLVTTGMATILTFAVWTVLTRITFEFSRLEIHFGLYVTMLGSLVATFYAFLLRKEMHRTNVREFFNQGNSERAETVQPPAKEPEDYHHQL